MAVIGLQYTNQAESLQQYIYICTFVKIGVLASFWNGFPHDWGILQV